ncbi:MAG: endolytic transglycosylase MltG [Clostridia bacterium]|nr:endolytic transglycosylase MltG [Clostridia bacterium]
MRIQGNGQSPLDELRKINEQVAEQKSKRDAVKASDSAVSRTEAARRDSMPKANAPSKKEAANQINNSQSPSTEKPLNPSEGRRYDFQNQAESDGVFNAAKKTPNPRPVGITRNSEGRAPQGVKRIPRRTEFNPDMPTQSAKSDTILYKTNALNRSASVPDSHSPKTVVMSQGVSDNRRRTASPSPNRPMKNSRSDKNGAREKKDDSYSDSFDESVGKGIVSSAVKAVIYIVCVLVVSGFLSLMTILVANDAFAFVKSGDEVKITMSENATLGDIASVLHDNGIIKYPTMFKLYCNLRHKTSDNYLYGEFTVSPAMGYDALIEEFLPSVHTRKEVTVTLIEGMNVDEIIDTFLENGIGTREGFVDVIQNYDFDFWFVDELDAKIASNPESGRKYRLEGYLFPDTYNFYNTASEADVIYKLLDNFNSKFDESMRQRAQSLGYTADQIVTMASMIQKEAKYVSDYGNVSSVFYNRLNKGQNLESNATVQYMMPKEEVELKLTREQIDKYDSAYNTYLHSGLPVGAICNPSLNSLNWALYPTSTKYYYFVSDSLGYNLFATTYSEHEKNCAKVESASADGQ